MRTPKTYAVTALALTLAGLGAVVATNVVVDPKALWSPLSAGLQRVNALEGGGRLYKTARLAKGDWQTIILGSSRCLRGLDPANAAFEGSNTFNACLFGTNMIEIERVAAFALARNPNLKRAVIGLDFEMFTGRRGTSGDFDESEAAGKSRAEMVLDYVLSFDTLVLSLDTLKKNASRARSDMADNGFVDWTIDPPSAAPRRRFDAMLRDNFLIDADNYGAYAYSPERVEAFSRLLAAFAKSGVRVDLYISPLHARQMEAISDLGLYPQYELWLADMARLAQASHAQLIDFSGYNTITTEAVPPEGSHQEMRWYWESSHFKKPVGDMILSQLSGRPSPDKPSDFGRALTPESVSANIVALHDGRERYRAELPAEAEAVAQFVKQTEPVRARLRRLLGSD